VWKEKLIIYLCKEPDNFKFVVLKIQLNNPSKNRCNAYIYRRCGDFSYVLFLSVFVRFYAFETVKKTVKILTKLSRSHRRLRTAPSAGDTVMLGGKLI